MLLLTFLSGYLSSIRREDGLNFSLLCWLYLYRFVPFPCTVTYTLILRCRVMVAICGISFADLNMIPVGPLLGCGWSLSAPEEGLLTSLETCCFQGPVLPVSPGWSCRVPLPLVLCDLKLTGISAPSMGGGVSGLFAS